jgi:hypothetical protein
MYPATLIQTEVLAKKRKALIVYGDMHYPRRPEIDFAAPGTFGDESIVDRLDKAGARSSRSGRRCGAMRWSRWRRMSQTGRSRA